MSDTNERDVQAEITLTTLLHMLQPHLLDLVAGFASCFFCAALYGWCIVTIGLWLGGATATIDPIVVPGAALNFVLSLLCASATRHRIERALEDFERL